MSPETLSNLFFVNVSVVTESVNDTLCGSNLVIKYGKLLRIFSSYLCNPCSIQVIWIILEYRALIVVLTFFMYGAASLKNRSKSSWRTPSGRNRRNIELSKSLVIVEKLAFSRTSVLNKCIFPGLSFSRVPIITFAIYLPCTSIVSSIETYILFPTTSFLIKSIASK